MESRIKAEHMATADGRKADEIIRKCVHCGFCLATCPTYQILGDERDSPRGRIYLIKELLEGDVEAKTVQHHLDRCLTCRACETTCPSGVEYGKLLDIGRDVLQQQQTPRGLFNTSKRFFLRWALVERKRVARFVQLAKIFQFILPSVITQRLPLKQSAPETTATVSDIPQQHRVILFQGCVQPAFTPATNQAAKKVLERLGVEVITVAQEGCCGALPHHLTATQQAVELMKRNIDAWWPLIDAKESETAVVTTSSACGLQIQDYAYLLRDHPEYHDKAKTIAKHCYDITEYLLAKDLSPIYAEQNHHQQRVAFHAPCTLQHGLNIQGSVETILKNCGYQVMTPVNAHLCCGSAGTYSALQPELSNQLQKQKIEELEKLNAECIVSANIGCQMHLQVATELTVKHWVELLV